jgi:hypothetical protein
VCGVRSEVRGRADVLVLRAPTVSRGVLILHLSDVKDGEIAVAVDAIASVVTHQNAAGGKGTLVTFKGGREWRVIEPYVEVRDAFVRALAEGS